MRVCSCFFLMLVKSCGWRLTKARTSSHFRPATLRAKNYPVQDLRRAHGVNHSNSRTSMLRHSRITVRCAYGKRVTLRTHSRNSVPLGIGCGSSLAVVCAGLRNGSRSNVFGRSRLWHLAKRQIWFFDWFSFMYTSSNPSFHLHFNNHVCTYAIVPGCEVFFLLFIYDYLYKIVFILTKVNTFV